MQKKGWVILTVNKTPPCRYCTTDRNATCHTTCKRFFDWQVEEKAKKEQINKTKNAIRDLDDYVAKQKIKNIEKRRKRER